MLFTSWHAVGASIAFNIMGAMFLVYMWCHIPHIGLNMMLSLALACWWLGAERDLCISCRQYYGLQGHIHGETQVVAARYLVLVSDSCTVFLAGKNTSVDLAEDLIEQTVSGVFSQYRAVVYHPMWGKTLPVLVAQAAKACGRPLGRSTAGALGQRGEASHGSETNSSQSEGCFSTRPTRSCVRSTMVHMLQEEIGKR